MVRLCWSESGAPQTEPPPRLELGQPRLDTDQVSTWPPLELDTCEGC